MKKEAEARVNAIFDTESAEPVLEREILPECIVCPDCGGITFDGLEFCHLCGGMLVEIL